MSPYSSDEVSPAAAYDTRLEHAVTLLRHRLEQHLDRESQLHYLYRDWHSRWTNHYGTMTRQLATLEAHLSTWMRRWQSQPRLTVVGLDDAAEADAAT